MQLQSVFNFNSLKAYFVNAHRKGDQVHVTTVVLKLVSDARLLKYLLKKAFQATKYILNSFFNEAKTSS